MKLWQTALQRDCQSDKLLACIQLALWLSHSLDVFSQHVLYLLVCPRLVGDVATYFNTPIATAPRSSNGTAACRARSCRGQLFSRLLFFNVEPMFSQIHRLTSTQQTSLPANYTLICYSPDY